MIEQFLANGLLEGRLARTFFITSRKKVTGTICATTNASRRCPPPGRSGK
jgi:hypothetical protein